MKQSDLLNHGSIKEALSPNSIEHISKLIVLDEVDSTNSLLIRELNEGNGPVLVCVAKQQTAGRGRSGKVWHSPLSKNIYLSLSWEYKVPSNKIEGLSLAIGIVILNVLADFGYSNLKLKWPNDILYDGAKLAGILVELIGDSRSSLRIITGIGINISMSVTAGSAIGRPWTDLSSIRGQSPPSRNELLAMLINRLIDFFAFYPEKGFVCWQNSWNARDSCIGKNIQIVSNNQIQTGISRGVDSNGRLILETPEDLLYITAGDVSLRECAK